MSVMRLSPMKLLLVAAAAGLVAALVMGAGRYTSFRTRGEIVSKVQIINFDQSVARFDTTTGEIHRFNGSLNKPNVRASWVLKVRGVRGGTSGYLDIQQAGGASFLVDQVTGDTWILRRRGTNASWDKLRIHN